MKANVQTIENIIVEVKPYLISEALEDFYASMTGVLSENTIDWYRRRLPDMIRFMGDCDVNQITIRNLRAWRADLASRKDRYSNHPYRNNAPGGLSPNSLHMYVRACRRLFHWLEQEGRIQENPAAKLELPRLPTRVVRGIKPDERDAIIDVVRDNPRDYAIARLLADTAARVGGISRLTISETDLENRRAIVHEKGKGGYGKSRWVFFSAQTRDAIKEWLVCRPDISGNDYLFVGYSGEKGWSRLTENGIYHMLQRAARKAGYSNGFNPHNWRHGAIRGMLSRGISLAEASQIAGHASVQVTGDIYGTFNDDALQARLEECSWMRDRQ